MAYTLGERPLVWVQDPKPERFLGGRPTPHLNQDGTLCLFDQEGNEWTPGDAISDTTVLWTMRWLFHYEHWVAFGDWRGDSGTCSESAPQHTL